MLADQLQDLQDCLSDLHRSGFSSMPSQLMRLLGIIDSEPLAELLRTRLPQVDFAEWWDKCTGSSTAVVGSGTLSWPADRRTRIAMQIELCRRMASEEIDVVTLGYHFWGFRGSYDDRALDFAEKVVDPMLRDIGRLIERRALPAPLDNLAQTRISTPDQTLTRLLEEARVRFMDPSPQVRRESLERLWDGWERLKTINSPNKQATLRSLIERVTTVPQFQDELTAEAAVLTKIGNQFEIRHFEIGKSPVLADSQVDYLFHRMFAMIWLLSAALRTDVSGA